jgi:hypothetical protein
MLLSANYTFCCTDTHQGCCTESLNSHCHPRTEIEGCLCYSCSHVLGLIEGEADKLDMSQDGRPLYPRVPMEAVNDLHDEAQTKEELAVVEDLLYPFFQARLSNNTTISTLSYLAGAALIDANLPRGPMQISDVVSKSPTVVAIHTKEAACYEGLETMLRSRAYQAILACSLDVVAVPSPKALDVPVN